jgi:putative ABC transport system ATP-binding protein
MKTPATAVCCRSVFKTYRTGEEHVRALRGIDLSIGEGEFVAIAGPSGSGKSTLLNLVGCLDTPDSGEVTVSGEVVTSYDDRRRTEFRNRSIGFVFQSFNGSSPYRVVNIC